MHTGNSFEEVQERLKRVMAQEPGLTSNGFKSSWKPSNTHGRSSQEVFERERRELLEDEVVKFDRACFLLGGIGKSAGINDMYDTYNIKHRIEECLWTFFRYPNVHISNGATIAAAIDCGFMYEADGASAYINISDEDYFKLNAGPPIEEVPER